MDNIFKPHPKMSARSHISSLDQYADLYERSINEPIDFWEEIAKRLDWYQPWKKVREFDFVNGKIEWFSEGKLNACYNCIDRHIDEGHGDDIAIIWEGNDPNQSRKFNYNDLLKEVSQFANALKSLGVEKGDRVCLFLPNCPEVLYCWFGLAMIGAISVPINTAYKKDETAVILNDATPIILIAHSSLIGVAEDAAKLSPSIGVMSLPLNVFGYLEPQISIIVGEISAN